MHARIALVFFLVAVSAGSVGSAPPEKASGAVWPEGFLESLENHADPTTVLRLMERALDGPPAARPSTRRLGSAANPDSRVLRRCERPHADVPIAADPGLSEYGPALAASPRRQNVLVSANVASYPAAARCVVRQSLDRGITWSPPVALPMLTETSICDGPALAYAPDGRTLYAVYRDLKGGVVFLPPFEGARRTRVFQESDVLLSRSGDDGRTWSAPVVALDGDGWSFVRECVGSACTFLETDPGETLERPTVAAGRDARDAGWVYVTANSLAQLQPAGTPLNAIAFAPSGDGGRHWGTRMVLDEGAAVTSAEVVQGSRVAAGPGGEVLVAWYDSTADGARKLNFEIRTRRSRDHGSSWDDYVVAVVNELELGLSLGPVPLRISSWWTAMFPDLQLDDLGRAHLVYTHDPEPGSSSAEEGDIRYVSSPRPPFRDWSSPETVNDDGPGRAQGFPSLALRRLGNVRSLEVVWEDSRLASNDNGVYDIFHSRLLKGRWHSWSHNQRVTDASSVQSVVSTGERVGVAANHSELIFAVWTDRRGRASVNDPDNDLYGSRIVPK